MVAKDYLCKICGKRYPNPTYSNSNDLKNHERSHLGKKGDEFKNWACDECNMKFYHPCRLARHKKTHTKPYVCHICTKPFTSNSVLLKHIKNKHGLMYVEESVLQPDEGVSQIFVQCQSQSIEKTESLLGYEKVQTVGFEKEEDNIHFL
ncbi:hypothetical protein NQ315_005541 [Exocentrus adspersus]|uniref:C2H2-type domain-containing protein n=1 Tax=Exocentrus adspersus TaxID=1586481 RepID=A0AAV8VT37_9CUCU|nr:hypothetical protein NQ315_005541 [Exocentrus adspersus]